ncbi:MAG: serine/threonine-protein kinase, partial [Bacteroidota bacterium]
MYNLNQGDVFASRYKLLEKLGVGGFSEVWKVTDQKAGNIEVALKIFAPGSGLDNESLEVFSREYSLVFNLSHPGLLIPKHFDDFGGSPYLVMPYCRNGSVQRLAGKFNETEIAKFIVEAASALEYLHKQIPPIIHLDIKPGNFLINENGNYLLTDFGISSKIRHTLTKSLRSQHESSGTSPYMAPERFSKKLEERNPVIAND